MPQTTSITQRLQTDLVTVSLSKNSYPTGVVKPDYGYPTFQRIAKAVQSKGHTFKNL